MLIASLQNHRLLRLLAAALTAVALATLVGCIPSSPPRTVSMRIRGAPPSAVVYIDGAYIGPFSVVHSRGVALPPGRHRISVEKDGYFPWDTLVIVDQDSPVVRLEVVLRKLPD